MLPGKVIAAVTGKALAAIKADALCRRRRAVRIVAGGAGEPVAALLFALALQESFPLAGSASGSSVLALVNKICDVIEEIVANPVRSECVAATRDSDFTFKMALQANGITTNRLELAGIENGAFAILR